MPTMCFSKQYSNDNLKRDLLTRDFLERDIADRNEDNASDRNDACGQRDRNRRGTLCSHIRGNKGFTLIEIMVVIVILGVLAALIVPNVMDKPDEAKASAARVEISSLMQALDSYRLDNQRYPTTEQGLIALVEKPNQEPAPKNWKRILKKPAMDPWGNPYQYLNPGVKGDLDIFSYGRDGQPGGEGVDSDVGSWELNR